jgi:hypothetical protein
MSAQQIGLGFQKSLSIAQEYYLIDKVFKVECRTVF